MSSMLREVLRWRGIRRPASRSEHWTNWARSLAERHGRVFSRSRSLAMTLALPPAPLFLRSQRWERYAWNLFPQINLAIGTVLRETAWKSFPVPLPGATTEHFLKLQLLRNEARPARQSDPASMESYARGHSSASFARERVQTPAALTRPVMFDLLKVRERESLIEHERVVERATADWPKPLSRVFRRMEAHETQMLLSRKLLAKESLQLVERVTHDRERIERAVERTTVVRQQKKEVAGAEIERVFPNPSISRMGDAFDQSDAARRGSQMIQAPAINIAELTEQVMNQIDSRIVAHKERMGKSF